jgi:hypothetical protein
MRAFPGSASSSQAVFYWASASQSRSRDPFKCPFHGLCYGARWADTPFKDHSRMTCAMNMQSGFYRKIVVALLYHVLFGISPFADSNPCLPRSDARPRSFAESMHGSHTGDSNNSNRLYLQLVVYDSQTGDIAFTALQYSSTPRLVIRHGRHYGITEQTSLRW